MNFPDDRDDQIMENQGWCQFCQKITHESYKYRKRKKHQSYIIHNIHELRAFLIYLLEMIEMRNNDFFKMKRRCHTHTTFWWACLHSGQTHNSPQLARGAVHALRIPESTQNSDTGPLTLILCQCLERDISSKHVGVDIYKIRQNKYDHFLRAPRKNRL